MDFLCLEIVNSSWYSTHQAFEDPLKNTEWILKLADKYHINSLPAPNKDEMEKLFEMRSAFTGLFIKVVEGKKLEDSDIKLVNSYMSDIWFYRQLQVEKGDYRLFDTPSINNWSWFMAEIAVSFSRLCSSETVINLKICQNPECRWFFIDESKSGNRKWCDDTCSNLMKVRRFRQKQRDNDRLVVL